MSCLCRNAFERSHCVYERNGLCYKPPSEKPRVRVKAVTRILGRGVPDNARPGDLVVGNRGAAARVTEPNTMYGGRCLVLEHVGNWYSGARPDPGCVTYDFRGT